MTVHANGKPPINFGLLHRGSLHQVAEVLVHRLCLRIIWLGDGSEHHGCCGHLLSWVLKVLCPVATFSELVTHLPHPWFLGFVASLLDVAVNPIELLDENIELLLLSTGGLAGRMCTWHLYSSYWLGDSLSPLSLLFHGDVTTKQALLTASSKLELGSVQAWLESSSSWSRTNAS